MVRFLLALLIFLPQAALADAILWKREGPWEVSFYPEREGCGTVTRYERGTGFSLAFDSTSEGIFIDISIVDPRWRSIESGKEYRVTMRFGDEQLWTLDMEGQRFDRLPGLMLTYPAGSARAKRFLAEFMRETRMIWWYDGVRLGDFSLRGSQVAMQEVMACQRSFEEATTGESDPFSRPVPEDDPFAQ